MSLLCHPSLNLEHDVKSSFLLSKQTRCYPERNIQKHLFGACDVTRRRQQTHFEPHCSARVHLLTVNSLKSWITRPSFHSVVETVQWLQIWLWVSVRNAFECLCKQYYRGKKPTCSKKADNILYSIYAAWTLQVFYWTKAGYNDCFRWAHKLNQVYHNS